MLHGDADLSKANNQNTVLNVENCVLTRLSRLLQKLAMISAIVQPATCLLQNASNASFRALWNSELPMKHSTTYCGHSATTLSRTEDARRSSRVLQLWLCPLLVTHHSRQGHELHGRDSSILLHGTM